MRTVISIFALFISFFSIAQNDLEFQLDAGYGPKGGYTDLTYTVTNISQNTISNLVITHPDAVTTSFTLSPSTLAPGATATATGRKAISGNASILGSTQATVTGAMNGVTITEQSDGLDAQGNRIPDGVSTYFISTPQSYGVIYVDVDLDSAYTPNVDTIIPGAVINAVNSDGLTIQVITNETGWWYIDPFSLGTFTDDFIAVIDQNSFPTGISNYQLVDGTSPFQLALTLAHQFEYRNGYSDGSTNFGLMKATAFLDENANGTREASESQMPFIKFEFIADNDPTTSTTIFNGNGVPVLKSDLNPGIQLNDVNANLFQHSNFFTINTSNFDDITTTAGVTTDLEFAVTEVSASNRDAGVNLTNIISPNPGFDSKVSLVIYNVLNGAATGMVDFTNDPNASIITIEDVNGVDLIANGTATLTSTGFSMSYNLSNFAIERYTVIMTTPTTGIQIGDTFTHTAMITPSSLDNNSNNNVANFNVDVVGSYDPNDMTEARGPNIPINTFSNSDYLEYTIRFQNLGTASAQFVRILSTLNNKLDMSTFEMITASHNYTYSINNGNELDWFFDDIQLTAESLDENGSHGFIRYRIKPLPGYAVGDVIGASAGIYFDYNLPVITEYWTTTFNAPASINDVQQISFYPNPLEGNTIYLKDIANGTFRIYALDGKELSTGVINDSKIILNNIKPGLYFLNIKSGGENSVLKFYKQ
ncbi:MAG: T9SS type A sorting domain-containing protein [Nonlabens sp.]|uniref:T9SS type A sorting domain-containing protein n=1 Tax=Nonlabens sp. TaxID=1888209 RepID=UPI003EF3BB7A